MYRPILASLGFILSKDKQSVLLVHRNKRDSDRHLGKYNGLGGKMESGEDAISCLRREVEEEAGLRGLTVELRGTVNWPTLGARVRIGSDLSFWCMSMPEGRPSQLGGRSLLGVPSGACIIADVGGGQIFFAPGL